jgi:hypothetical protein
MAIPLQMKLKDFRNSWSLHYGVLNELAFAKAQP